MARFPKTEADTVTLAHVMVNALATDAAESEPNFPTPPVVAADLGTLIGAYSNAKNAAITAQALAE